MVATYRKSTKSHLGISKIIRFLQNYIELYLNFRENVCLSHFSAVLHSEFLIRVIVLIALAITWIGDKSWLSDIKDP